MEATRTQSKEIHEKLRGYLRSSMEEIYSLHTKRLVTGTALAHKRAAAIDSLIKMALGELGYTESQGVAIVALGGYGRQELCPYSDIDILFLYDPGKCSLAKEICESLLYNLWDINLKVGHSIRTIKECMELAHDDDVTILTSLLDGRFLWGDLALWETLDRRLYRELLPSISSVYIEKKLAEYEKRIDKYGRSVYILEPHVKEGEGGLRDIHAALWIAKAKFKVKSFKDLLHLTVILQRDLRVFEKGLDFLLTIRSHLHYLAGRQEDRLSFQWQEEVARFLGYKDIGELPGIERFMRVYYLHANMITDHSRKLIDRCTYKPKVRFHAHKTVPLEHGFIVRGGELSVSNHNMLKEKPENMMRAFEYSDRHGVKLSPFLLDLIRDSVHLIDDKTRRNPELNASFLRLLKTGKNVAQALFEMNRIRLLGHYIPEFGKIVCLAQHDAYHVYTVDVHSIFMIRELEERQKAESDDGFSLITELAKKVKNRHILYLACLFHDMGKGQGRNHAKKGALMVPKIAERMGLSKSETAQLKFLVRRHLIMTHLSQRRDIHDEDLIHKFAETVKSLETLNLLYLLTFADIRSVGPDVWTNWKDMLLRELYMRTAPILAKGRRERESPEKRVKLLTQKVIEKLGAEMEEKRITDFLAPMPVSYFLSFNASKIAEHIRKFESKAGAIGFDITHNPVEGYDEFTFWGSDEVGIFSKLCGVLTANGINILGARIVTRDDGRILDVFYVNKRGESTCHEKEVWEKIQKELMGVLTGEIDVEELVQKRKRYQPIYQKPIPRYPSRIEFDNESSSKYTVIDIYAHDREGLLYDVTKTLTHLGLSIEYAKISTKVDQVADVFYVRDLESGKIFDTERLEEIKKALLEAIEEKVTQV
ncbi:MAG: [protein-PII] uridylyltransferase [Candidatus Methanosuratincola sp.]|jgi:[protein-PII] uridylyltransferase